jgi:phage major head subunit gpT-like protein
VNPNLLVVPTTLERQGKEILMADLIADPGGVNAGVTNVNKGSADLLVVPELNALSATAWYLLDVSKPIKPFVFVMRETPLFVSKQAPDDDGVFWDDEFSWGVQSRGEAGYGLWFQAFRGNV